MKSTAEKRSEAVDRGARQAGPMYGPNYRKACEGEASPRNAIKAHCLECCGWQRLEVAQCSSWSCALWEYRPWGEKLATQGTEFSPGIDEDGEVDPGATPAVSADEIPPGSSG